MWIGMIKIKMDPFLLISSYKHFFYLPFEFKDLENVFPMVYISQRKPREP